MRSTTSFQSSKVCPELVIIVAAWQVVQAVSTICFPLPSGNGRAGCIALALSRNRETEDHPRQEPA